MTGLVTVLIGGFVLIAFSDDPGVRWMGLGLFLAATLGIAVTA